MKDDSCEELPYPSVISVKSGIITDVNDVFLVLTGYSEENFIGNTPDAVFKGLLKLTIDPGIIKSGCEPVDCFLFTRGLEARDVLMKIKKGDSNEQYLYVIKEKPDSRLENKLQGMEKLFDDNKMGVCVFSSPDLRLLKANDFYLEMMNEPFDKKEEALGHTVDEIAGLDSGPLIRQDLSLVIGTGQSYYSKGVTRLAFKNGKYYHNTCLVPFIKENSVGFVVGIYVDATTYVKERERNDDQKKVIEQQKEQFKTIIENMSDGLLITDRNANILLMNAAARAYYPDPDRIKNLECGFDRISVTDEDGNQIPMENMPAHRASRGEKVKDSRVVIDGPFGKQYFDYTSSPIYDDDGNIAMVISCSRDVTDNVNHEILLKTHHEQLLNAEMEKNEALKNSITLKDEFLSLISHEFKTPITVIISAIQAMEYLCGEQFSDKARGFIGRIKQNAYRQLRLVNNLLEITKIDSGQSKLKIKDYDIVFLSSSIAESVLLYANQKGINLEFSSTLSRKIIGIDDEKFERILLNLLSNAIKFTPKGKSVFVRVSETTLNQREMVSVEVEDEGIGIPEDKQEMIFEKFFQVDSSLARQAEGTGLGLSLVKLLVDALGGIIKLESHVGKGSNFTVSLPSLRAPISQEEILPAGTFDNRLVQSVEIEFSDLYL